MKVVLQVVKQASVSVNNTLISKINSGYLLLVGIEKKDTSEIIKKMAKKIIDMRINKDENGKTNLSIKDVGGEILSVSQFTLCADLDSRRPSFSNAASPDVAKKLYEEFNEELSSNNIVVKTGVFKEHMEVSIINDGPFTINISL